MIEVIIGFVAVHVVAQAGTLELKTQKLESRFLDFRFSRLDDVSRNGIGEPINP